MAGLERLLPMYPDPVKGGALALFGSILFATLVNAVVVAIYTAAIVLTLRVVG
jgi:hypothetical protein